MRFAKNFRAAKMRWVLAAVAPVAVAVGEGVERPVHAQSATTTAQMLDHFSYRMVGANRGGRVTTVTGIPSQPHTFFMGVASGGIFKTTDAGHSWLPITDGKIPVGSIGDIAVAGSNPDVMYVGTGSDGLRSNVSTGRGVYKTTDGGDTWSFVGLRDVGQIGAVRIHPTNPDIVYLSATGNLFARSAERGIYMTRDGGRNWTQLLALSDSVGASDVELHPSDPSVVYAWMARAERKPWTIISGAHEGGFYKSTDSGATWKKVTNGLPTDLIGKGNLGVSPADPDRLYLLVEALPGGGVYRSDDAGESWTMVSDNGQLVQRPFYYTTLGVDPTNADVVYAGAEGFFKSEDGGVSWDRMNTPHGDNHDIWVNPYDSKLLIQANDGGANVSFDGGESWSTQHNQPTAEYYGVWLDNQVPYRLYAAQQDNTTLIVPSLPLGTGMSEEWRVGPGCETGPIIPHPVHPDTVYGSCKGQFSRMALSTGQEKQYWVGAESLYGNVPATLKYRFQRVSPMAVSEHNPSVLYYGSQHVHRSTDEGVTWQEISPDLTANVPELANAISGEPITRDMTGEEMYPTLYAITESPHDPNVIWTGSNDGPFYITRNGGGSWTEITPPDLEPGGRVQFIDASPHRPGSAYYAVYRYLLGDFAPYIYATRDYGQTWRLLTPGNNGIPGDVPTRVVREDPDREGLLYAGTEFGLFISMDDGRTWQSFQNNLPVVPVTDIKVFRDDLVLSTQGRSFWIMDDLTPLHQFNAQVASADAFLFEPRDAYRFRYSTGGGEPWSPQYPAPGPTISYWLGSVPSGPVTIEILDAQGSLVNSYSSDAPAGGGGGFRRGGPPARVTKDAGLNRFTWNMTYPGPTQADGTDGGRGPMALPGEYTVRLMAGGETLSQSFTLILDPRSEADITMADLEEQLAHNMRTRELVTDMNQLLGRVSSSREQSPEAMEEATRQGYEDIYTELATPPIRYSTPGLEEHVNYLYGMTLGADQKVGRDAIERYEVLRQRVDALIQMERRLSNP